MPSINARLACILETVDRPGDFSVAGVADFFAPALDVQDVGPVALPLLPAQAEQLIAAAEAAPYDEGEQTLVDPAVPHCWQIGPDRVQLTGRRWSETLERIVNRAAAGLGVVGLVSAAFSKLLIYGPGSFFVPHRDIEKAAGMFATLVIVLPSRFTGGELIVRHKGREAHHALHTDDAAELAFAAFYADCAHEIRPLAKGYRLTLVYNLVRRGRGTVPEPPDYADQTAAVVAALEQWRMAEPGAASNERNESQAAPDEAPQGAVNERPDHDQEAGKDEDDGTASFDGESNLDADEDDGPAVKLVFPLEHAYTQAEFSFAALKGTDAAVAGVLAAAAHRARCSLYLARLTIEESGGADYGDYPGRRGPWDEDEAEWEAGEMFDRIMTLSEWRGQGGQPVHLDALPAQAQEFVPPHAVDELAPDEEHFSEATGNEGASYQRTYRRASLVLWPQEALFAVLGQGGLDTLLAYLDGLTARLDVNAADTSFRAEASEAVRYLLEHWSTPRFPGPGPSRTARMLAALGRLGDHEAIEGFVQDIVAAGDYGPDDIGALVETMGCLPAEQRALLIERIVAGTSVALFCACANLLAVAARCWPDLPPARLRPAATILLDTLPDVSRRPVPAAQEHRRQALHPDFIIDLLSGFCAIDAALASRAVLHMLAVGSLYDMDRLLVPAARALVKMQPAGRPQPLEELRRACLEHLRTRIAETLEPPADWRRASELPCQCERCSELSAFLADPTRQVWTLKANFSDRGHVEDTIQKGWPDLDTATEQRSRPYSLVCTKNQASYDRRVRQRAHDQDNLAALQG